MFETCFNKIEIRAKFLWQETLKKTNACIKFQLSQIRFIVLVRRSQFLISDEQSRNFQNSAPAVRYCLSNAAHSDRKIFCRTYLRCTKRTLKNRNARAWLVTRTRHSIIVCQAQERKLNLLGCPNDYNFRRASPEDAEFASIFRSPSGLRDAFRDGSRPRFCCTIFSMRLLRYCTNRRKTETASRTIHRVANGPPRQTAFWSKLKDRKLIRNVFRGSLFGR